MELSKGTEREIADSAGQDDVATETAGCATGVERLAQVQG